ncbi:MAG: alpha/beta-hydrolase family protein [Paracoccus sp. (in: a-proteobacteria)]|nr:alpha/beta-hydrolase family protein [Paracoccus sp. (in: a-proteobacteria)]
MPLRLTRPRLAVLPLLAGLSLAALSLTPSLVPRDWLTQGVLAGLSMGLGYLVMQALLTMWRSLGIAVLTGRAADAGHLMAALPVMALVVACLARAGAWQDDIRSRVGLPPADEFSIVWMSVLALAVFAVLFVIGWLVQGLFDILRRRLARYIPVRMANVIGLLLAAQLVVIVTRDGVVNRLLAVADASFAAAQQLTDPDTPAPAESWRAGGPGSLIDWAMMGKPGRDFVLSGADAATITAVTGRPARDPLRIYVGLAQDPDPQRRAAIALAEMDRLGAFRRKVLVVASPTGTGWLDPAGHDPLDYMHDGDIATVAVQYSYLQSPLALIFETDSGLEQASALMRLIHDRWRAMDPDTRPRLYMAGISLGAWSSMNAFNVFQMMNDPVDGALWAGPPFPSQLWRQAVAARNPGSRYVLPEVGAGDLVRFASQYAAPDRSGRPWGRTRILFLQYASDPIVFFDATSAWRAPRWMREPPAPDVSPLLDFVPIVTQLQLGLDMMLSKVPPPGFGHDYHAHDYIAAWAAVSAPDEWSEDRAARLRAICGQEVIGCAPDG